MQLEYGTLLEQARANHAQACANHEQARANQVPARANQATAEATLLAMRRSQGEWFCLDGGLDAWFLDAHGVAEVARVLAQSQDSTNEEPGRHQAHDKAGKQMCHGVLAASRKDEASLVSTPPRARVGKAWHECEVYDIGEDSTVPRIVVVSGIWADPLPSARRAYPSYARTLATSLKTPPRTMIASCLKGSMLALMLMLCGLCRGHQKATMSAQARGNQLRKSMMARPNRGSGKLEVQRTLVLWASRRRLRANPPSSVLWRLQEAEYPAPNVDYQRGEEERQMAKVEDQRANQA